MENLRIKVGDIVIAPVSHKSNNNFKKDKSYDRFITKNKEYLVLEVSSISGGMFIIKDDNDKLIQSFLNESSFINYENWIIKNKKPC